MEAPTKEWLDDRLAAKRVARLAWWEKEIEIKGHGLVEAFKQMKEDPLEPWLGKGFADFEEYCKERWGMTKRRLYQIEAAQGLRDVLCEEVPELKECIERLPERAVRELSGIPKEARVEVVKEAYSTQGKPTAAKLKVIKARVLHPEIEPVKMGDVELCPTCGRPV